MSNESMPTAWKLRSFEVENSEIGQNLSNWKWMVIIETTRQRMQYLSPQAWELVRNVLKIGSCLFWGPTVILWFLERWQIGLKILGVTECFFKWWFNSDRNDKVALFHFSYFFLSLNIFIKNIGSEILNRSFVLILKF